MILLYWVFIHLLILLLFVLSMQYKAAKEILILARGFQNGTIIINSLLSNRLHVEVHTHHSGAVGRLPNGNGTPSEFTRTYAC